MVEPVIVEPGLRQGQGGASAGGTPRTATAERSSRPRAGAAWVLRLLDDAWVLSTPGGVTRQALEGLPALQLERMANGVKARNAPLRAALDDAWLRYLVVQWPKGIASRAERDAYLALRFREVHGVAAPEWTLAIDRDNVSFPVLACAAPVALVGAIQAFAAARQLRLAGVTGDFVACFNDAQRGFTEPLGSFGALAVARGTRVTIGMWQDAAWQAVRSQVVAEEGAGQTVRRALESWCMASPGHAKGTAPVGVLHACGLEASAPAGWRVEVLRNCG